MTNKIRVLLLALICLPWIAYTQTCQSPITVTLSGIACNNNGTPLDSLDDVYSFQLSVTGDSMSWSVGPDSTLYPYDSTFTFGPFPIANGPITLVVLNTSDSLCTDTALVSPPPPCSVPPPMCQTPISASFAGIACNDNGTPLDSLDDTFTLLLTVTGDSTSWSLAGDTLMFPYDSAATAGPFLISAGPADLIVVNNSDSLCVDTVMVTPPPPCSVPLKACDVKEIGCMKYELLEVMLDSMNRKRYTIIVTNTCPDKMIYTAFQLPDGLVAKSPDDNTTYTAPSGREYLVRNPNFSPFYSIRFKSTADSIANGGSDIFEYTLQPQANPDYIHVVTRVAPKVFYEAHLNTFKCRDSLPQMVVAPSTPLPPGKGNGNGTINNPNNPPVVTPPTTNPPASTFTVYPNPTTGGQVSLDLTAWKGQQLQILLLDLNGALLKTVHTQAIDQVQPFDLPTGLDAGIYWLKVIPAGALPMVQQLVIQW